MGNEKNNVVPENTQGVEVSTNLETQNKEIATSSINNDKKKKTSKWAVIAICISLVFLVFYCCISFVIHNNELKKEEEIKRKETALKNQQEAIDGYGQALESAIDIQYNIDGTILTIDEAKKRVHNENKVSCKIEEINNDRTVYLSQCIVDGKSINYNYGIKIEAPKYSEDTYFKVYYDKQKGEASLTKTDGTTDEYIIDAHGKYKSVELLSNNNTLQYVQWIDSENRMRVTDYTTGKDVLSGVYYLDCYPIKNGSLYTEYAVVIINNKSGVYNFKTGEEIVPNNYDREFGAFPLETTDFISLRRDNVSYLFNYKTGEIKLSGYAYYSKVGNYIVATKKNSDSPLSYKKEFYDTSFNKVFADYADEVYDILDNTYLIAKKDNRIKILDISGNIIYDVADSNDYGGYFYGGKFQDGILFQFRGKDNKCVEFIYSKQKGLETKDTECAAVAKPILYLYPKKTTKVTVNFEHPEYLKTTYPKFENQWIVKAKSNGDLYDKNGRYYYGLYWDENRIHTVDFSEGFYVEDKDAINFLEKKLDYIGLSEREANEFITYWLPILENNKKNLVYFELTDERESYNKININPKPDSLLRIVIHIKKVDKKTNIKEEKLTQFKRNGFTAVEWGGTTY